MLHAICNHKSSSFSFLFCTSIIRSLDFHKSSQCTHLLFAKYSLISFRTQIFCSSQSPTFDVIKVECYLLSNYLSTFITSLPATKILYETKKGNHHTLTLKAGKMDTTRNEHLIIEIGIQLRVT